MRLLLDRVTADHRTVRLEGSRANLDRLVRYGP
jgi:hypothetical protein